jgi:hypothetical protein
MRDVVRQRALAAGGTADEHGIALPAGLRQCLGLAEMKAHAGMTGLVVGPAAAPRGQWDERSEVERIRRRAENAFSPGALADEAEIMLRPGEPPCL